MRVLGRIAWTVIKRLCKALLEVLVWVDQGLGLILCLPFYLTFGHPTPNSDATISHVVGTYANDGYKWAIAVEWVLDRIFYIPEGFKLGHCRKKIDTSIDWDDVSNFW